MKASNEEREAWFWLNHIAGVGNARIHKLLEFYEDEPIRIYQSAKEELMELNLLSEGEIDTMLSQNERKKVHEEFLSMIDRGNQFVLPCDEDYPESLRNIYDKPFILYYRGKLPGKTHRSVAIVGSRRCSEYGRATAYEIAYQLALHGVDIISGLALGIDCEAHKGALAAGGRTFGVLAGGVGKCYPMQNFNIYMDMIEHGGGVLSEYPDGNPTLPGMFPIRNRIISGLSEAVIIVEAGHNSGSLITATLALEQNRDVYAVPGRVGDPNALGCNELIGEGAGIVSSIDHLLESLGLAEPDEDIRNPHSRKNLLLAPAEKMIYSLLLDFTPKSLEDLLRATGLTVSQSMQALTGLEIKGLVREISKNFYVRIF